MLVIAPGSALLALARQNLKMRSFRHYAVAGFYSSLHILPLSALESLLAFCIPLRQVADIQSRFPVPSVSAVREGKGHSLRIGRKAGEALRGGKRL